MFNFEDDEHIDWDKVAQEVEADGKRIESSEREYFSYLEKNKEYEKFFMSIKDDTGKYMAIREDEALELLKIMAVVENDRLSAQVGCMNSGDIKKENEKKILFINALLSRFRGNRDVRLGWNTVRAMFARAEINLNAF